MTRSDKAALDNLERFLVQMHQVQGEPDFTLGPPHLGCPSHELAYDEDAFLRVFGEGDEQKHNSIGADQAQFDHGHKGSDF
jgi:hypothetical protein